MENTTSKNLRLVTSTIQELLKSKEVLGLYDEISKRIEKAKAERNEAEVGDFLFHLKCNNSSGIVWVKHEGFYYSVFEGLNLEYNRIMVGGRMSPEIVGKEKLTKYFQDEYRQPMDLLIPILIDRSEDQKRQYESRGTAGTIPMDLEADQVIFCYVLSQAVEQSEEWHRWLADEGGAIRSGLEKSFREWITPLWEECLEFFRKRDCEFLNSLDVRLSQTLRNVNYLALLQKVRDWGEVSPMNVDYRVSASFFEISTPSSDIFEKLLGERSFNFFGGDEDDSFYQPSVDILEVVIGDEDPIYTEEVLEVYNLTPEQLVFMVILHQVIAMDYKSYVYWCYENDDSFDEFCKEQYKFFKEILKNHYHEWCVGASFIGYDVLEYHSINRRVNNLRAEIANTRFFYLEE
jgi:hypothetical protein